MVYMRWCCVTRGTHRQFYNRIQAHKFGVKGIGFGPGARLQEFRHSDGEGFSAGRDSGWMAVLRYEDRPSRLESS